MLSNHEHTKNHRLGGITCTVSTCSYHGSGNCCQAPGITVGTEYAVDKTETFCSTYDHHPGL